MRISSGIAVSSGVAIGEVRIQVRKKPIVNKQTIQDQYKEQEKTKYLTALQQELQELDDLVSKFDVEKEDVELLDIYREILNDPLLKEKVTQLIDESNYTAEYALHQFYLEISTVFRNMKNPYLAEREADYEDIVNKLINRLNGSLEAPLEEIVSKVRGQKKVILVMEDISPSDVARSYHTNISGICLVKGSRTSHSAIIARALGIPVVVGVSDLFFSTKEGDTVIVDGNEGLVIINPDDEQLSNYQNQLARENEEKEELASLINVPARTQDGFDLTLLCNIELKEELSSVIKTNADGVGLYRTEFLYVDREELPSEEEQFHTYKTIAKELNPKEFTIRTFDLGGDKLAKVLPSIVIEQNPFLGCRGIRLSLQYPEIFKTQIRAVLRASHFGNISLMFPMISSADEMQLALDIVEECKNELSKEGVPYNKDIKVGAMIEVPAVVLSIEALAKISDFFSIGTNDLVQYTLAADRNNKSVAQYYNPYHPAIIKLITITAETAKRYDVDLSVCGELASDLNFAPLLIGMGITKLSVNPSSLLSIKKKIVNAKYNELKNLSRILLQLESPKEVKSIVMRTLNKEE
jgi:phosphotransferase system enzyme I (PtsI)